MAAANYDYFLMAAMEANDFQLIHYLVNQPRPREPTYSHPDTNFDIENLTNAQLKAYFRFGKGDILMLRQMLGIPKRLVLPNRCVFDGDDVFWIFLSHAMRYGGFFGRSKGAILDSNVLWMSE